MRLTTKGRFAVTAMLDVALYAGNAPVTLAAIAQRQKISLSYLEQLFGKLRRSGLVDSVRGPGGGYQLGAGAELPPCSRQRSRSCVSLPDHRPTRSICSHNTRSPYSSRPRTANRWKIPLRGRPRRLMGR